MEQEVITGSLCADECRQIKIMPAKKKPKRDACYHKVKRAMPKTSAYRLGHMVCCRVGAKLQHWWQEKW